MLKIGEFSKLGSVTVKALRHYARLGLLRPAWTDRFSGYRYYTLQQLPRLNRILALKDLGFSLEQIAGLVNEDVPVEQLRGMLLRKQKELETRLRAEQNRLEWVAARLSQLESGGEPLASAAVLVKRAPALPVAAVRAVCPAPDRLNECLDAAARELSAWLAEWAVDAEGPWMAVYPAAEYRERDIPFEVAVEVAPGVVRRGPADPAGRIHYRTLFPAELACLVHAGPAETLGGAYTALYAWMEAHRRRPAGPARELHLRDQLGDQPPDPFDPRPRAVSGARAVEIQIPIEPIASAIARQSLDKENTMQPKIITRPEFTVMGLCYHGNNQNQEIAAMWGEFNQREREVLSVSVPNSCAYGVCIMAEGLPEGHFEYVAGYEVPAGTPTPEGMVQRTVPPAKYAVFEHRGAMDKLSETYHNIYQVWLPQSGLEIVPGIDMEVYTEEFKDFAPDSVFYIYVPVK